MPTHILQKKTKQYLFYYSQHIVMNPYFLYECIGSTKIEEKHQQLRNLKVCFVFKYIQYSLSERRNGDKSKSTHPTAIYLKGHF
jgi:hypothetical protein